MITHTMIVSCDQTILASEPDQCLAGVERAMLAKVLTAPVRHEVLERRHPHQVACADHESLS
jgi:hypothetical protein